MNLISSDLHVAAPAAPGADPARAVDAGGSMPLVRQYLRIAMRWRFVILGAVAACIILGLVATLLMTPKYTATSTIEIARESNQVTNFQGVEREASIADQEFYQTQYGLLRSRTLAERVAAQLRLIDDKEFFERSGVNLENPAFQEKKRK